jgi:beta-galactosidase
VAATAAMKATVQVRHALHGRLLAYIQTTGKPGKVLVQFSAPGLKSTSVTLTVK